MTTPQNAIGAAITPDQWLDLNRRSHDAPELRLIIAVLEDAMRCVSGRGNVGADWQHYNRHREEEARAWLKDDSQGVFSFRWVTQALGLDATAVRARVAHGVRLQRRRSPANSDRERIRA